MAWHGSDKQGKVKSFTNRDAAMAHERRGGSVAQAVGKPQKQEFDDEGGDWGEEQSSEMQPHQEAIQEGLKAAHEGTGEAHSHIEHHEDGSHTSHHIGKDGEMSGPHDHENIEALKDHMDQFLEEEGREKAKPGSEEERSQLGA